MEKPERAHQNGLQRKEGRGTRGRSASDLPVLMSKWHVYSWMADTEAGLVWQGHLGCLGESLEQVAGVLMPKRQGEETARPPSPSRTGTRVGCGKSGPMNTRGGKLMVSYFQTHPGSEHLYSLGVMTESSRPHSTSHFPGALGDLESRNLLGSPGSH